MSTRAELVASVVHQMQFYQVSIDEALRRVTVRDLNYWRYWHRLTDAGQAALRQVIRDANEARV